MKNLVEYINESIISESLKEKAKDLIAKVILPGLSKDDKWLKEFVNSNDVKQYIKKIIDRNDLEELGYEMVEYGGLTYIPAKAYLRDEKPERIKKAFDLDSNWQVSKINPDVYVFLPALEAWDLKLEDVDTEDVLKGLYERENIK